MLASCPGKSLHPAYHKPSSHFLALADPTRTEWLLCPSTPAAILFTVLFALTTVAHLLQAIYYKKIYCWVIIGSALAQTINYICRIISIKNPNDLGPYAAWFVIILVGCYEVQVMGHVLMPIKIAPLFTNAFVYMVMGGSYYSAMPQFDETLRQAHVRTNQGELGGFQASRQFIRDPLTCGAGRMIWNYIPDAKLYRVTAWRFSTYFVVFDVV
jgi:hypothetical protein